MSFENIENFDPSQCINGKVARLSRMTAQVFRKHISPFGVTTSQVSLMFILSKREGLTQKELAQIAKLEKSSLNRNLDRLVDQGYISRHRFPILTLDEKGKHLVSNLIPAWEKAMKEIRQLLGPDGEQGIITAHDKLMTQSK